MLADLRATLRSRPAVDGILAIGTGAGAPLADAARNKNSQTRDAAPSSVRDHVIVAMPGVFLGAELAAWHISLHMTSVANSTLLVNMTPIFVALISWVVFRKAISRVFVAGLAFAVLGVFILKSGDMAIGQGSIAGDTIALGAAGLYAGYILLLGKARARLSTMAVMVWSTTSATLCVLPFALLMEPEFIPWTVGGWAILAGLAWISHAGGQSLITFALAWLPATFSSLALLLQPFVAAILAWLLLDESLGLSQIVGGLIILGGIALARRGA